MSAPLDGSLAPTESRIVIVGGSRLSGSIPISGSKNAALAILAGALLAAEGETILRGLPCINDIGTMAQVLRQFGVRVSFEEGGRVARLNAARLTRYEAPADLVARMRASFWALGPLLARMRQVKITQPGGCNIGARPIDLHLKGLAQLGAEFETTHGNVIGRAPKGLSGESVFLDFPSVGATMNIMMAASLTPGTTRIVNAAQEPDVEDLGDFLKAMGADITGQGTGTITINGVEKLHGCDYTVSPDRIEAGTFAVAVGATGGDVFLEGANATHMLPITLKLIEAGVRVEEHSNGLRVVGPLGRPKAVNVRAMPHPGFPTDMQQALTAMLTISEGTCIITDEVYENRFRYLTELARMGAYSQVNGRTAVVNGVSRLTGADVEASDLRAAASLVVAGLAAEGTTRVFRTEHLDRGYERFVDKLRSLGAEIWREDEFGRAIEPLPISEGCAPAESGYTGVSAEAVKETACSV